MNERAAAFHRLHGSGCFVMPNPWDVGSATVLEAMGFPALATTSAGFAWTQGVGDSHVGVEQVLDHLRAVAGAVAVFGGLFTATALTLIVIPVAYSVAEDARGWMRASLGRHATAAPAAMPEPTAGD